MTRFAARFGSTADQSAPVSLSQSTVRLCVTPLRALTPFACLLWNGLDELPTDIRVMPITESRTPATR